MAAAGAALLVALPLLRRGTPATASLQTREDLVAALARLDLAYEAGDIAETAYREQRLRLKAQLRDLAAKDTQG